LVVYETGFLYAGMCKIRSTKDKHFLAKVIIGHEMLMRLEELRFNVIIEKVELRVALGSITGREMLGEVL